MSMQYTLIFRNNSTLPGDACVYQTNQTIRTPGVYSLAWFAQYAYPTTQLYFQWSPEHDFVWAYTGTLAPGVIFLPAQVWNADPDGDNSVTFSYDQVHNAYYFEDPRRGGVQGNLYIGQSAAIPAYSAAAVGIGMSGSATFAMQAQSNFTLSITPQAEYWICFGAYAHGEVLDISAIPNPARVEFPQGIYSMTAVLNQDNTWTVKPTSACNAELLKSRNSNPAAVFAGHGE